ncbi:hypothetical protein IV203_018817 [Nitzschia inconspicua]|uniref:Uncharacterized protein n=1 Tax=Nitzschia inconspicua TaxID=303405 RepID=A0A9K3Q8Z6_9STRA|nr:hypothetical protein IV203_018817 [Nitzschia inconspicua]
MAEAEQEDIMEHAKREGLHVKPAGRHSGHKWYCFDCKGTMTTDRILGHTTDHASFDSDQAIKDHMVRSHNVHWTSAYWIGEDAT